MDFFLADNWSQPAVKPSIKITMHTIFAKFFNFSYNLMVIHIYKIIKKNYSYKVFWSVEDKLLHLYLFYGRILLRAIIIERCQAITV